MRNIWTVFKTDIRTLSKCFFACVVVVAIALLPSLYAWLNIYSNWDPSGNTGNISIAVASLDKGWTEEDGTQVNKGREVVEDLRSSTSINWVIVDTKEEAQQGVYAGDYYAAVVIDEDFSYNMYHMLTEWTGKPTITYYENYKKNAVATKITDTAVSSLKTTISKSYLDVVVDAIFRGANDLSQQLSQEDPVGSVQGLLGQTRSLLRSCAKTIDAFQAAGQDNSSYRQDLSDLVSNINQNRPDGQQILDTVAQLNRKVHAALDKAQTALDKAFDAAEKFLNGIDVAHYNPESDPLVPYHFTVEDRTGKARCKREIQRLFGLNQESEWPLLASVARLVEQKGIELIREILPQLMDMGVQLIVFGQGDPKYIEYFNWAKAQWPGQLGFSSDYNEPTASAVFAGADMYLMPSRFEPCGLSQMMAMRYGTVPIVHETGGLKDSVRAYKDFDGIGDGFAFSDYQAKDLYLAISEAVKLYFGDEAMFDRLRVRCMKKDFSWDKSAERYNRMYEDICGGAGAGEPIPFEEAFDQLRHCYMENERTNRVRHESGYQRVVQITIIGRGAGTFTIRFNENGMQVEPTSASDAEAYVHCSFDNLLAMARGFVTVDKLYLSGQLRLSGNLSKGFEIRYLLSPAKQRA